ncbi:MAG: hypothetical protein GXP55_13695 [Deltaproteobacteria bacterium]|nr:hypothetical protein [Deltaproteobacteria bacterium]
MGEQCDDGNPINTDLCRNNCTLSIIGGCPITNALCGI